MEYVKLSEVAFLSALMVHSAYVTAHLVISTKAFRDEVHFYQSIVL